MTTIKSIEEKAKRYDEAIEALGSLFAEQAIKHCDRVNIKNITNIFPELIESEDEKIRKAISQCVEDMRGQFEKLYSVHHKDAISWLEKQGEHANFLSKIQVGDKVTRNQDGMLVNLSQLKRVVKPAGKFPKYEKGDILTDGKNKYEVLSWDYTETGIAAYYMKGVGCNFSWSCEEADKKLHLVEQKPAEWSEEDEDILNTIINHFKVDIECTDEDDTVRWLKSLKDRYTWKPSELQIEALESATENCAYSEYQDCLRGLITQLKKLREE